MSSAGSVAGETNAAESRFETIVSASALSRTPFFFTSAAYAGSDGIVSSVGGVNVKSPRKFAVRPFGLAEFR